MNKKLEMMLFLITFCLLTAWVVASAEEPGSLKRSTDGQFIDNGDQTVTDSQTGLMWTKDDSYLQTGHWLSWPETKEFIKELNEKAFAGYVDWRAPTVEELITLYNPNITNSAQVGREMKIHTDPVFGQEGAGNFWSSEGNGRFNAFGVEFNTGGKFNAPKKSRARKAIRATRSATP